MSERIVKETAYPGFSISSASPAMVTVPAEMLDALLDASRYAANALRLSASAPEGSSEAALWRVLSAARKALVDFRRQS